MAEYVQVNERAPVPEVVRIGKCNYGVIGFDDSNQTYFLSGSANLIDATEPRLFKIYNLAEFEALYNTAPVNTPLVKAIKDYFGELDFQADSAVLYCYRASTAQTGANYTDQNALKAGGLKDWRTEYAPPTAITAVKVHYNSGFDGNEETVTQDPSWYALETDSVTGKYTGKITFGAGYPHNSGGESQDVGDDDEVLVTYSTSGLVEILAKFNNLDVQYMSLAYDNGKMQGSGAVKGIYGTSWVDDLKQILAHCIGRTNAGFGRRVLAAGPANKLPTDSSTAYGGTSTFGALRSDDIGNSRNFILCMPKMTVTSTGTSVYYAASDAAPVLAAWIRKRGVRGDIKGLPPTTPLGYYENQSTRESFKAARIITVGRASHLRNESFVTYGICFGTGREKKINNVSCKFQIKHALQAGLLQKVFDGVNMDSGGMKQIRVRISSVMKECQINGWHDGLITTTIPLEPYLDIPVSQRTQEQKDYIAAAQLAGIVDNIEVTYAFAQSVDSVVVSALGDE